MTPRRYLDRDRAIVEMARGRRVLHLGCVGHTEGTTEERVSLARETLHWKLTEAASTVGVDYSSDVIDAYRRLGVFHNIVLGDVQRLEEVEVDDTFEIVVAADIIEHLSNPGAILDGIKRFCAAHTRVVLTTPHAFGLPNYVRFVLGRFRDGAEHVITFNIDNICNLLKRHGYAIERLDTCHQPHARRHGVLFVLGQALFRAVPKLGGTLFVVARPVCQQAGNAPFKTAASSHHYDPRPDQGGSSVAPAVDQEVGGQSRDEHCNHSTNGNG